MQYVTFNKYVDFHYEIESKIEAGIVLQGWEIKSIRKNGFSLKETYANLLDYEFFLCGCNLSRYPGTGKQDPKRERKLLLKKNEIIRLSIKLKQKGYVIVPISAYFKGSFLKILLGLGKGKKNIDKKEKIIERESNRKIEQIKKGMYF